MTQTTPKMLQISPEYYSAKPPAGQPAVGTMPTDRIPEGAKLPLLLQELEIPRGTGTFTLKNRASVPPMCMYSAHDGFPTPFHIAHHGQFALHGMGSVVVEATAVSPEGRISPADLGIWKDEQIAAHASLVQTIKSIGPGVYFGLQIAHAGRKASTPTPWLPGTDNSKPYVEQKDGGWPEDVIAPSAIPAAEGHIVPHEMTIEEIHNIEKAFVDGAARAYRAGYDFVEIHSAHGYMLSSFNSPLSNKRTDEYGGSFENRTRLLRNIAKGIRGQFPDKGLWVRINGTDAVEYTHEDSWTIESTKQIAPLLEEAGVDVLDISSGGTVAYNRFNRVPGYQLPLSGAIKDLGLKRMKISAVGVLQDGTEHEPTKIGLLAEESLQDGKADIVSVGRGSLKNPNWVELAACNMVGVPTVSTVQYEYAVASLKRFQFGVSEKTNNFITGK
ncbi:hypothetical protein GLX27_000825 [Malassezia furfur]|uniref:NADH:flavin oxidoreductase/NADH oxidase N-terminal domain-containing protein n=1 Tax=Malassezia furfur TaxID=55194 RepID=A0ABY8EKU1_MALFU|nr:hypothetical protein CBS14141_001509 [Malassezia furfur]WFD46193.1 hypothetical protein GLX27_000825 [Malassezia furfur]